MRTTPREEGGGVVHVGAVGGVGGIGGARGVQGICEKIFYDAINFLCIFANILEVEPYYARLD